MTELYLVRHGETDWNAAKRIQGSTDIPLNAVGIAQAERTAELLTTRRFVRVVSSPLSRAAVTADIIAARLGLAEPERIASLAERRYGQAEGMDYRTIDALFPPGTDVPGRETREALTARVMAGLRDLAAGHPGERIVAVAHGGVIRAVLNAVEPDNNRFVGVPITNGSVHSFRIADGQMRLVEFDDPIELLSIEPGADDYDDLDAFARRAEGTVA